MTWYADPLIQQVSGPLIRAIVFALTPSPHFRSRHTRFMQEWHLIFGERKQTAEFRNIGQRTVEEIPDRELVASSTKGGGFIE